MPVKKPTRKDIPDILATIGKIQRLDQPDDDDVVTITLPKLVMWSTDPLTLAPVKVEDRPYVEAE